MPELMTSNGNSATISNRRRIDPLTLILINAILPFANMLFPSDRNSIISMIIGYFILFVVGRYKTALKSMIWIGAGVFLYEINIIFIHSAILGMMLKMTLLFLPCVLIAILIVTGYNSSEILSALQRIHLPKIFIIGLTVTIRYIPTFRKEFSIIKQAMFIRGVKFSILHPVRTFEYLLVPQLFRCVSLSSELTAAGLTKGISAEEKRTSYFFSRFTVVDYIVFVLFVIGLILIVGGTL